MPEYKASNKRISMEDLIKELRKFAKERDWEQFHSPKNLSMALAVEVAEILEIFQWLTEDQTRNLDQKTLNKVKEEIGDIQIYLVRLSDQLGFSPLEAAHEKLKLYQKKYPPEKAKGNAKKYTEFE
jgi:NTP pyrophosphatase (non-canonical NTP hydrolase)